MVRKRSNNMLLAGATFAFAMLILLILSPGCSKEGGCITSTGPVIFEDRSDLGDFDSISLNDNVNLILTQGTKNIVQVEAGQNIIGGITTEVINRTLIINNKNICNWLRRYDSPLNVYVTIKNLAKITYNSSGDIRSTNQLTPTSLKVEVWGGCGTIDLSLDISRGDFSLNLGTTDFKLRGRCGIAYVFSGAYGLYDGKDLKTEFTFITNKGSNDCYVNCLQSLVATIGSIGNIYYSGYPILNTDIYGTGKVIKLP